MGWYHDPNFSWGEGEAAPACSLPKKTNAPPETAPLPPATTVVTTAAPQSSLPTTTKTTSGGDNTACLLPADSPPPPPPPDVASIFHLCQKSLWDEAVRQHQPYFPPTYMKDGKFTRATVHKKDLVSAANQYYQNTPGEWMVIEIDCTMLFGLGIPILAQDAPESTSKQQPVKCLQVFGGISTTLPGLIKQTYKMKRRTDGSFVKVLEPPKEDEKKEDFLSPCLDDHVAADKKKPRRFWQKIK